MFAACRGPLAAAPLRVSPLFPSLPLQFIQLTEGVVQVSRSSTLGCNLDVAITPLLFLVPYWEPEASIPCSSIARC
jgi:hypothetical protein